MNLEKKIAADELLDTAERRLDEANANYVPGEPEQEALQRGAQVQALIAIGRHLSLIQDTLENSADVSNTALANISFAMNPSQPGR